MNPPKVFISATSGDLRSARQIVKETLLTINCHPVEQTNFEPDARTLEKLDREKLEDCQALIHIVGFRYGAEPGPATLPPGTARRSYTQLEYHVGRRLQAERGDGHFRVYVFLCPEGFPFDAEPDTESADVRQLQQQHRENIRKGPHRYEEPQNKQEIQARILALQEQVISLEQDQQNIAHEVKTTRHWGVWVSAAILLILGGIGVWVKQTKKDTTAIVTGQADLATQMNQVQEALSRLQQQTDPQKDPISGWPQERLEKELAQQMNLKEEDLRALLTAGKTSLDALVAGQALLASGKADEAGQKFDTVIAQEQSALQRLRHAYDGKAQIAYDKARYQEALDYRQKAAALADKGADPVAWADAQGHVAFVLDDLASHKEAEPLMREVLRMREQHLGPNDPQTATALNDLAQLLQDTNRLAEAEPLMQRALKIDEASFGQDHPKVARDLSNLAALLQATNRLTEAEPMFRRALKIDEASFGPDHPNVAIDLNNLAELLRATNRFTEAEPLIQRSLLIDEARFGPDHPNVAIRLNNLAQLLQDTNHLTEAEPLMQRVLKIHEASFGPDHPDVAIDLNNLAELLRVTNRHTEAEPMYRRALMINEASFGPDHPNVAIFLNNLALLLQATDRVTEAEPLMQRALKIDEASYGSDHPNVAIRLNNLAQLLQDTNHLTEAEPLMQRTVGILLRFQVSTGHRYPGMVTMMKNYLRLAREMKVTEPDIHARLDKLRVEAGLEAADFEAIWQEVLAAKSTGSFQVVITEVVKGGQAEALGLQAEDVYVSYNGEAITSMNQFIRLTSESKGEVIALEVLRAGKRLTFTAKPGKFGTRIENRPLPPATESAPAK